VKEACPCETMDGDAIKKHNLFEAIPAPKPEERFDNLLETGAFRVERIVSRGHRSPEGFWYDQDQAEWVLLVQGQATLAFENGIDALTLNPGDYISIPAHQRHRVLATAPDRDTVWLAIHFQENVLNKQGQ